MLLLRFLVFVAAFFHTQSVPGLYPILLVPGDVSSHLKARYVEDPPHFYCGSQNKWFNLWLNPIFLLPASPLLDCFIRTAVLDYDPITRTTSSPYFTEISVPGFGTVDTISYLTDFKIELAAYFSNIIKDLVGKYGYIANKNILGAPYDFRKGPNEMEKYFDDVKVLIEKMSADNGGRPTILIGHSMGNLHLTRLLNRMSQAWKDKYVKAFISISAPYLGSMKALLLIISGHQLPVPYITPERIKSLVMTWPSTYYLFPSPKMWSKDVIVMTSIGNFTVKNIKTVLQLTNVENAVDHYENVVQNMKELQAPNVTMHCIYSTGLPTISLLDYSSSKFPLSDPDITYGDGDSVVNLQSLKQCALWKNNQTYSVQEYVIPGVSHLAILKNRKTLDILEGIITKITL